MSNEASSSPIPEVEPPSAKLFTAKAIGIGAFIGGPLAATTLLGLNFSQLGRKKQRNQTYLLGLGLTLSYFWLVSEIPQSVLDKIPTAAWGGLTGLIAYLLTENLQGELLRTHFAKLGQKASGWAVTGWSTLSLVVTLALILFLYVPMLTPFEFEKPVYSDGLLGNEIYHGENVETETVKALGQYLVNIEYFDSEYSVPVQIRLEEEKYELYLSCLRDRWEDPATLSIFRNFAADIEADVLNKPVTIVLVDEDFNGVYRKRLN